MLSMDSPTAFALAKIQPPRSRTSLVERPTLEQALDIALRHHRLTLLVAPAGYGKTAALTRQIRRLGDGSALAWVSVDEDDRLQRFLACLTTALEPHDLPWRVSPEALGTLAQAEHGLRDVARELVNALAATEVARGLIVIDDAHRLADPQVFELLQAVIERLPEHWGVAIASRVDPPLSLARWRASGDLAEFRQYDLRFSEAEVGALLRGSGLEASAPSARELLALTDGWAAGLRLSLSAQAGAGRTRGAGGPAQRHLFDYLASEVLADMPADLRWFLLRCSVLPELSVARCEHVARLPNTARLLDEVERRGLFVATLDADELTLRLHDLFRDFLESRLQRDFPGELPYLLRRAADHEGDLVRAVGYLTRAGAWDEATRLLVERGAALITRGGGPAVEQMLAQFPPEQVATRPGLQLLRGGAAFPRFDFETMVDGMQRAADGYAAAGEAALAALARAYASLGRQNTGALAESVAALARLREQPLADGVRAFVGFCNAWGAYAQGRGEDVAQHVAAMLDALETADDVQDWDRCFFLSILTGLPGLRPLLERFADGAMRLTGEQPTQLRAGVMHIRAWLAFSQGGIDEAAVWLARADDDCRWLGRPRSLMTENWMAHTLIDAVRGDRTASYAAAQDNKRDLEEHALRANRLTHEYEELFTFLRAAWVLGDETLLRALAPALERTGNPFEWAAAESDRAFARAMLALLDGRLADAQALLQPLAADLERSCFFPAAQARLMLADVQVRRGAIDDAAATLQPWLAAALDGGDVGGALLAGRPVLQRLAGAGWGRRLGDDEQALLARLERLAAAGGTAPAPPAAAGGAPGRNAPAGERLSGLTEREREVLARMAAGDSNKLIARAFDLSPHTVKRHVANILDKLGVDTRGQAAARWREMVGG
ncbi:MAG: AAA family ATPase [Burkholderiaceae bacterium]|nr:AAA family ATPase [Burkholderiaceae bacterium]